MDNFFENLIDYPRTGLTDQMFKLIGECFITCILYITYTNLTVLLPYDNY